MYIYVAVIAVHILCDILIEPPYKLTAKCTTGGTYSVKRVDSINISIDEYAYIY